MTAMRPVPALLFDGPELPGCDGFDEVGAAVELLVEAVELRTEVVKLAVGGVLSEGLGVGDTPLEVVAELS